MRHLMRDTDAAARIGMSRILDNQPGRTMRYQRSRKGRLSDMAEVCSGFRGTAISYQFFVRKDGDAIEPGKVSRVEGLPVPQRKLSTNRKCQALGSFFEPAPH